MTSTPSIRSTYAPSPVHTNLIIRRMTKLDVPEVYRLEKMIFSDPWQADSFRYEVNNAKISFPCVLVKDSLILGYAVTWCFAGEAHLGNIAIHPDYRRQGLARVLMDYLLEKYQDQEAMYLEVRKSNRAAIKLYRTYGFLEMYQRRGYYSDGEDAIVMCKELTNMRK